MSTPRISPLFEGKKGPLPPASVLCWTPAVRKQYPLPAPTNSFLKMFFFPPLPFPPPAIMSFPFLTHSHPSFLPPYKPWVMNEVLKIKTWMHDSSSLLVCHHLSCTDFWEVDKALHIFFSWFCQPFFFKWQILFLVFVIHQMFAVGGRQIVCA